MNLMWHHLIVDSFKHILSANACLVEISLNINIVVICLEYDQKNFQFWLASRFDLVHKHWIFITSFYSLDDEYQNNMKLENFPTLWITVVFFIFHKQWNYTQKILLFFNVKENNQSMLLYLWNMHIKSMLCFFYSTNFTTKIN